MLTKVKLLNDEAEVPKRAHSTDSGYDIKMIGIDKIREDVVFFQTGVSIQPPEGHYFELVPRSSISKFPLALANSVGIIDEHYRGEIKIPVRILSLEGEQSIRDVALHILAVKPVLFQMILRRRLDSDFEVVTEINDTVRGDGGFGSTD